MDPPEMPQAADAADAAPESPEDPFGELLEQFETLVEPSAEQYTEQNTQAAIRALEQYLQTHAADLPQDLYDALVIELQNLDGFHQYDPHDLQVHKLLNAILGHMRHLQASTRTTAKAQADSMHSEAVPLHEDTRKQRRAEQNVQSYTKKHIRAVGLDPDSIEKREKYVNILRDLVGEHGLQKKREIAYAKKQLGFQSEILANMRRAQTGKRQASDVESGAPWSVIMPGADKRSDGPV